MALSATGIIEKALKNGELECGDKEVTIKSGDFKITVKDDDKKHEGFDRVIITDNNGKTLHNLTWKKLNKTLFNDLSVFIEKNKETDCPTLTDPRQIVASLGKKPMRQVEKLDITQKPKESPSPERTAIVGEFKTIQSSSISNIRTVESDASTAVYMNIPRDMEDDIGRLEALKNRLAELKDKDSGLVNQIDGMITQLRIAIGKAGSVHQENMDYLLASGRRDYY